MKITDTGLTAGLKVPCGAGIQRRPSHHRNLYLGLAVLCVVSFIFIAMYKNTDQKNDVITPDSTTIYYTNNTYDASCLIRLESGWLITWNESAFTYNSKNAVINCKENQTGGELPYISSVVILIFVDTFDGEVPVRITVNESSGKNVLDFDWNATNPVVLGGVTHKSFSPTGLMVDYFVNGSDILRDDWAHGEWKPSYGVIISAGDTKLYISKSTLSMFVYLPSTEIPEFENLYTIVILCMALILVVRTCRKRAII